MSTPGATCSQCGASAAGGRIFCTNCGASLQDTVPLIASDPPDPLIKVSALKRVAIVVLKGIGGIAALVFWFSRITTNTGILLFGISIVVGILCVIALSYLDDDFLKGSVKERLWPKPLD